ncbi:MAG TPA: MarR family winged helix-turn-helix transcriptional regulator [Acidimicrobiales bacterium]
MDPEDAGCEIWRAIADLFFSAENQARFFQAAVDLRITPPTLKALLDLEPDESVPMRRLADEWGCDASFVTVTVDNLEQQGYAERRVAEHDRRVKTVQLTPEGVAARERAIACVYGPRRGFYDLAPDERVTLATLLRKLADAQAVHDQELVASGQAPPFRAGPPVGHRGPWGRGPHAAKRRGPDAGESWRDHLAAHREELRQLRDELSRVRAEVKAQLRSHRSPPG